MGAGGDDGGAQGAVFCLSVDAALLPVDVAVWQAGAMGNHSGDVAGDTGLAGREGVAARIRAGDLSAAGGVWRVCAGELAGGPNFQSDASGESVWALSAEQGAVGERDRRGRTAGRRNWVPGGRRY